MSFESILYLKENPINDNEEMPKYFNDLHLDQIINNITLGKQEYNLKPFFFKPLNNLDEILYRHEIMKDLENQNLFSKVKEFCENMSTIRNKLEEMSRLNYELQKDSCFLDIIEFYCNSVENFVWNLMDIEIKSSGFKKFLEYVKEYIKSEEFAILKIDFIDLKEKLLKVKYCLSIKSNCVKIKKYENEKDYNIEIEEVFKKFIQDSNKDYKYKFNSSLYMNHVEAKILEIVSILYPDIFETIKEYRIKNKEFQDIKIKEFDREVQFYMCYLEYIKRFKRINLNFCYPEVSTENKEIFIKDGFDLSLSEKLINQDMPIVCNDFYFKNNERIFVISGPNQGGKTTFARMFGQLHYLSAIGCPIPGSSGKMFLFDNIFTHFEREEDIKTLNGKLQDDLIRIHDTLIKSTPKSIIIMNEIFSSTTLHDAIFLGKEIMNKIIKLDALCVFVTFAYELADIDDKVVSMVSAVIPENNNSRTFKIIRKDSDGLAYAISLVEKYHLTYKCLKERIL
ncbi:MULTISPECIES: mismatch repair ATPase (MutS family) [unclassified Clostridium]|uniref:MutS-related protein n=1 Tax=unclassified Clostridium TaxID=2614128 RepID=UPI0002977286|nr:MULTISPECIES: mismatch repair ATPase (MutS family) [unclassified Clostridium]EKQ54354.1 MAG: mismatch repair ATPase (MutS family) [Clostridium sp. Maddingley MBC34-26]